MDRLSFLRLLGASLLAPLATPTAAQSWPARPIRFIIPFPAGGSSDVFVRTIQPRLAELLGQPLVLDYRAGASGTIGLDAVAKAAPDGYTIGLGSPGGLVAVPHMVKVPYAVDKDFTFITQLARVPTVFVTNNNSGINSARELIDRARAEQGRMNYAHPGKGTLVHLAAEIFMREARLQMVPIPYKGAAPAVQGLLGNQVPVLAADLSAVWPQVSQGLIRPLLVTSAQRSPVLPNVPSMTEVGLPGAVFEADYGILAPAGLPPEVLARLSSAFAQTLDSPPVREAYLKIGALAAPLASREYRDSVLAGYGKWGGFIKEHKITAD